MMIQLVSGKNVQTRAVGLDWRDPPPFSGSHGAQSIAKCQNLRKENIHPDESKERIGNHFCKET